MLNMTLEDRTQLTIMLMLELDSWGLNAEQLITIMCLPSGTPKRALRKYRENTAFPSDENVDIRIEHIIGIIDALRTSFPHNKNMSSYWMKQRNKRFQNRRPIQCLIEGGLDALVMIRAHLDCSFQRNENDK